MVRSWTEQGVDFPGYRPSQNEITVAPATVQRGVTRLHRLDEQQGRDPQGTAALGDYVSRWWRWAAGGVTRPAALPDTATVLHIFLPCSVLDMLYGPLAREPQHPFSRKMRKHHRPA